MCSGFEVLVDCGHVEHHALPIRPLSPHHLINVLAEKEETWLEPRVTPGPVPTGSLTLHGPLHGAGPLTLGQA